jgi:hypothetical protein
MTDRAFRAVVRWWRRRHWNEEEGKVKVKTICQCVPGVTVLALFPVCWFGTFYALMIIFPDSNGWAEAMASLVASWFFACVWLPYHIERISNNQRRLLPP